MKRKIVILAAVATAFTGCVTLNNVKRDGTLCHDEMRIVEATAIDTELAKYHIVASGADIILYDTIGRFQLGDKLDFVVVNE